MTVPLPPSGPWNAPQVTPPSAGAAASVLFQKATPILKLLVALVAGVGGLMGYQHFTKSTPPADVQQSAPVTPVKKACGKCGSEDCGCQQQLPVPKKVSLRPVPDFDGQPSDKVGNLWRWDATRQKYATESPFWDGAPGKPAYWTAEEAWKSLEKTDPLSDSNKAKPTSKAIPTHVTDANGLWWAIADPTDADQRSWFSDDAGKSWWRGKKPALMASSPTTCKCPAEGNKSGSEGPNNCLCHEQEQDCKCHKGAGIVFDQLPANPPAPAINGVSVKPAVAYIPMMAPPQSMIQVKPRFFVSGGSTMPTTCKT